MANSEEPDQTALIEQSDQVQHWLHAILTIIMDRVVQAVWSPFAFHIYFVNRRTVGERFYKFLNIYLIFCTLI